MCPPREIHDKQILENITRSTVLSNLLNLNSYVRQYKANIQNIFLLLRSKHIEFCLDHDFLIFYVCALFLYEFLSNRLQTSAQWSLCM